MQDGVGPWQRNPSGGSERRQQRGVDQADDDNRCRRTGPQGRQGPDGDRAAGPNDDQGHRREQKVRLDGEVAEEVEWVDGRPRRGLSKGGDHRDQDDSHHDQPDDHRHRKRWRHRCVIHGHGLPPRRGWRAHHTVTGPLFRRGVGPDTGQDVSRPGVSQCTCSSWPYGFGTR